MMAKLTIGSVLSTASMLVMTWRGGTCMGSDAAGNRYYRGKPIGSQPRERRWVMYGGLAEASTVPPEWYGWLHHQIARAPAEAELVQYAWQKPPQPNLTGTDRAYRPPGHTLESGVRDRATGDYEAWSPPQ
jgi:NADH:ubiquinone oxidoreductase subunit